MKGHYSVPYCPPHLYYRATQRQLFVWKSFCEKVFELALIELYTRNSFSLKNPIFIFIVLTNFPAVKELKMERCFPTFSLPVCYHADILWYMNYITAWLNKKYLCVACTEGNVGLGKKGSDWRWASGHRSQQFNSERSKGVKEDFKSWQKWHHRRCLL